LRSTELRPSVVLDNTGKKPTIQAQTITAVCCGS
jgi:hypothetical protein